MDMQCYAHQVGSYAGMVRGKSILYLQGSTCCALGNFADVARLSAMETSVIFAYFYAL
jgi:hypothetical protein